MARVLKPLLAASVLFQGNRKREPQLQLSSALVFHCLFLDSSCCQLSVRAGPENRNKTKQNKTLKKQKTLLVH
jgi:hypothetical protein